MAKTRKNRGGWSFNLLKWFKRKPISATTNNVYEPIQTQGRQVQPQYQAQTSNPNNNEYHLDIGCGHLICKMCYLKINKCPYKCKIKLFNN